MGTNEFGMQTSTKHTVLHTVLVFLFQRPVNLVTSKKNLIWLTITIACLFSIILIVINGRSHVSSTTSLQSDNNQSYILPTSNHTKTKASPEFLPKDSGSSKNSVSAIVESNGSQKSPTVTVNNQSVSVPSNGTVTKHMTSSDGQNSVDISVTHNQSSASQDGSSYSSVEVHTSTTEYNNQTDSEL